MTTITKERAEIKSFITGFLSDPAHDNQSSDSLLANVFRIAQASLEAEPLVPVMYKGMKLLTKEGLELIRDGIAEATGLEAMCMADALLSGVSVPSVPSVPKEMYWQDAPVEGSSKAAAYATGWNACREAMLQSGKFRDNKNSSTNNFREIPETSTNSPGTPAGWISCSERMLDDGQEVVVQTHSGWRYIAFYESHSGLFYDSPEGDVEYVFVTHWMQLPEPPQEVNQ